MSYSRSAKPQMLEILAVESLYLPAVVSTEKNWRILFYICTCYMYESYRETIWIIIYFTVVNKLSQFEQFFSFLNLTNSDELSNNSYVNKPRNKEC